MQYSALATHSQHTLELTEMYFYRALVASLLIKIGLLATLPLGHAEEPSVTAPNFWDPKAVHDRPAAIPDKIQFLTMDGYPPFVFRDPNGRLTGFNVDLARALCQELEAHAPSKSRTSTSSCQHLTRKKAMRSYQAFPDISCPLGI